MAHKLRAVGFYTRVCVACVDGGPGLWSHRKPMPPFYQLPVHYYKSADFHSTDHTPKTLPYIPPLLSVCAGGHGLLDNAVNS